MAGVNVARGEGQRKHAVEVAGLSGRDLSTRLARCERYFRWLTITFGFVNKFHAYTVLRTPSDAAAVDATVRRNAEDEIVRDFLGFQANNPGSAI